MNRCHSSSHSLGNEDRISQLPEALLLRILSFLPTKNVVATSVLSKRWLSISKTVPNLKFICNVGKSFETYSDYVSRFLLSHQAPFLQSLNLDINCVQGSSIDIGTLIGIAFGLHVRKLVLSVSSSDISMERFFRFPRSLCNYKTLETLKLRENILLDVAFPVSLKSLKTLHLVGVHYKDDESVINLLSGCSSLENLVVERDYEDGVNTFTIVVPTLKKLALIHDTGPSSSVYVINVPSLKYLNLEGYLDFGSYLMEKTLELEELYINICGNISLGLLTSVKRLSLLPSGMSVTYPPGGCILYQLVYLKLHTNIPDKGNLLTYMLENSPNLQVLDLIGGPSLKNWSRPEKVPKCLLLHLQTLVWTSFRGQPEEECDVLKYILKNACCLRKAVFLRPLIHQEKRLEMLAELESEVKASNSSCQLVVKWKY